jgi:predicted anti-sigma-YlaC factor YlaD
MDCSNCVDDLTAYMDGELSEGVEERLRLHLNSCASCTAELRGLQEAAVFVDSHLRELNPRPELWASVRSQIAVIEVSPGRTGFLQVLNAPRWLTATVALAATLLLTLGVWEYIQRRHSDEAFQQYMTQQIEIRRLQDETPRFDIPVTNPTAQRRFADNPFVTVSEEITFRNPFREGGR